ncbi:MAG: glycosyltransferase [Syntrophobacterales bacterium]|jgi:glycosyltransferase involved in cell wall biosynthesis
MLVFVSFGIILLKLGQFFKLSSAKPFRSLWAGTPILTLPILAKGERLLGVDSSTLVYQSYFLSHAFDYNFSRWFASPIFRMTIPYVVFLWACWKFQRFHFFCDAGLLPQLQSRRFNIHELKAYHLLKKQVFFYTYGADVRTRLKTHALGEFNCCLECPEPERACICDEVSGEASIEAILKHATALFSMGDMIEYTPGSRNDLFFWPVDFEAEGGKKYTPRYPTVLSDSPIRIVHAANHRHFKGTRFLIDAVEHLRTEGLQIELILVERVPNREALEIYRKADIVFDQCLIGFHGYFAIEGMALGKPVMAYIRKPEQYLIHHEECPIINSRADQIESVLRQLANDRKKLHELGVAGRRYAERYLSVEAFAQRLDRTYNELGVNPTERIY